MGDTRQFCAFAEWSPATHTEPAIRVGTILPEDDVPQTDLVIPGDDAYRLEIDVEGVALSVAGEASVAAEADRVTFHASGRSCGPAACVALCPTARQPLRAGRGARVTQVTSGRGFHWQKRFCPTLIGDLVFRAVGHRLLLVNVLPLEAYLGGVITGEMSGECPPAFLESQCIVARSWVLARSERKHADLPIDRCNDDCCQRYHGTGNLTDAAIRAVEQTRGRVLLDRNGRLVDANYSKSCGGIMELPENVWGVRKPGLRGAVDAPPDSPAQRFLPLPDERLGEYLRGEWLAHTDVYCSPNVVPDGDIARYLSKVDEGGGHFRWSITYMRDELEDLLRRKAFGVPSNDESAAREFGRLSDLRVVRRGVSGRATEIEVAYETADGQAVAHPIRGEYAIRNALHETFLFSSAFQVRIDRDARDRPTRITLVGAGWGHGAGLCQIGALGMALRGHPTERILSHYFEDVTVAQVY
jgi:stage II sporulation protein D